MNTEMERMSPQWKQRWLEALRGGKYQQGHGGLRGYSHTGKGRLPVINDAGYCCLGVLCDVVDPTKWAKDDVQIGGYSHGPSHNTSYWFPGSAVAEEAGLSENAMHVLAAMNDTQTLSFEQIADWIEQNL